MIHVKDFELLYFSEYRCCIILHRFFCRTFFIVYYLMKHSRCVNKNYIGISITYEVSRSYHSLVRTSDREEVSAIEESTITTRESHSYSTIIVIDYEVFFLITICITEGKFTHVSSPYIHWLSESFIKSCGTIYPICWEVNNRISEIDSQIISMVFYRFGPLLSRCKLEKGGIIIRPTETTFFRISRPSLAMCSSQISIRCA